MPDDDGMRLDRWLRRQYAELVQSRIEAWARRGELRVDGRRVRASTRLAAGQQVRIPPLATEPDSKRPDLSLSSKEANFIRNMVIWQDDRLIALNKPPGIAVQGGTGTTSRHIDAMVQALVAGDAPKPRLTHRLDRATSGVLVLAVNRLSASELTEQFRQREIKKLYWALTAAPPKPASGRLSNHMVRRSGPRKEIQTVQCVDADATEGVLAITDYKTIAVHADGTSWLELSPRTGRMHQLRVHMAHIGCPVLGDRKYGQDKDGQLCLHARSITLPGMEPIVATLPEHFRQQLDELGFADKNKEL